MHQEKMKEKKKKKKYKKNKKHVSSDNSDSEDEEKKKEKLKKVKAFAYSRRTARRFPLSPFCWPILSLQALEAEDKRVKNVEAMMQLDERKRPYHSLQEVKAPTEEEIEAFRMKRCRPDDPMASFLGQWRLAFPRCPRKTLAKSSTGAVAQWNSVSHNTLEFSLTNDRTWLGISRTMGDTFLPFSVCCSYTKLPPQELQSNKSNYSVMLFFSRIKRLCSIYLTFIYVL